MGFTFGANLYANCSACQVTEVLASFYREQGHRALEIWRQLFPAGGIGETLAVHDFPPHWACVDIHPEPEQLIRERHLFVSAKLKCPGFFLFEHDGDYWGYEFFDTGQVVDRFTSNASYGWYFDGMDCRGSARAIAHGLPFLTVGQIEPYLVRLPDWDAVPEEEYERLERQTDVAPREGDRYRRWDECAALNFLRMLGVDGDFTKRGYFRYGAPVFAEIEHGDFGMNLLIHADDC